VYRVLVGKLERKRPLRRPTPVREGNIKTDLRGIELGDMNWIHLVLDRNQWRVLVNMVRNLRFP
jgi:hypothetical protein